MRETDRPLIEDGRKRYGTVVSNETDKKFDRVETPGGTVKLPHPMTDAEYKVWLEEHNRRAREEEKKSGMKNADYPSCAKCGHSYEQHHGGGTSSSCQGAGCNCDGYRMSKENDGDGDTFVCDICGDTEREGLKTVESHTGRELCEACAKKKGLDNATVLAPGMKSAVLNSVEEGRQRYGAVRNDTAFVYCATCDESIAESRIKEHKKDGHKVETVKNSKCPICDCDMDAHDKNGYCDNCGEQCG